MVPHHREGDYIAKIPVIVLYLCYNTDLLDGPIMYIIPLLISSALHNTLNRAIHLLYYHTLSNTVLYTMSGASPPPPSPLSLQPGLVASITYRDRDLWSKGFGVTKKDTPAATPDKDTIYRIASVSKIFVVSCECFSVPYVNTQLPCVNTWGGPFPF